MIKKILPFMISVVFFACASETPDKLTGLVVDDTQEIFEQQLEAEVIEVDQAEQQQIDVQRIEMQRIEEQRLEMERIEQERLDEQKAELHQALILGIKTADSKKAQEALRNGADINQPFGLSHATPCMLVAEELVRYGDKMTERQFMRIIRGAIFMYTATYLSHFIPELLGSEKVVLVEKKKGKKIEEVQPVQPNPYINSFFLLLGSYSMLAGSFHTFKYLLRRQGTLQKINELTAILELLLEQEKLDLKKKDVCGRTVLDRMKKYQWHTPKMRALVKKIQKLSKKRTGYEYSDSPDYTSQGN